MTTSNKDVVNCFNKDFFEKGNKEVLKEIVADTFINHSALPNFPTDIAGLIQFVEMLHKGFADLRVDIHEQLGESDLISTRKTIHATHTGEIMGHRPTGKSVIMNVIDIIKLKNGKIVDHWGRNDFMNVIQQL